MTAARKTQNGAKAGARRTSSATRKTPATASRRAPASKRKATPAKRKPATRAGARRPRTDHRVIVALLIGTLVLAGWTLYPVLRLQYQQQREKTSLEQELAGLKDRNETLRAQVDRLKTPAGVEEAARESLGLVRKGEKVYVVTDGETTRAPQPEIGAQTRSITASEASVWTRVLDVVFGFR